MTIRPRRAAAASLWILAAISLAAQGAGTKTTTLAALKGPSGIGLVRLFETAPVLPDGQPLRTVAVGSADIMAAKVISGEFDAAVLPVNMAAKLRAAGIPLVLAAIVGDGMVSFLTTEPSIRSLADLRGQELHVAGQGATPEYLLRRLLKDAGLDPDRDIKLNFALPYPEMAAAIASGKIRHAVLPEPFATQALVANPGLFSPLDLQALWKASTGQESYPMTALVVSGNLAATDPAAVRTIMAAAKSSLESVKADPAAAGLLVETHELGLKAAVATRAIPRSAYVFRSATAARPGVEALLGVFLAMAPASVGGKLPDPGFYGLF